MAKVSSEEVFLFSDSEGAFKFIRRPPVKFIQDSQQA